MLKEENGKDVFIFLGLCTKFGKRWKVWRVEEELNVVENCLRVEEELKVVENCLRVEEFRGLGFRSLGKFNIFFSDLEL